VRREEEENPRSHAAGLGRTVGECPAACRSPFHKMSARLVLAGRLGLDPARGLNREPKALSQSGICHARERWRGEMIGGALLPVKSMAKEGPFRVINNISFPRKNCCDRFFDP
jgi:hypothetical protein